DALEPIRADLGKIYFGDRGDTVNAWKTQLNDQIERAETELEVVLSEYVVPIQSIMGWKPGTVIEVRAEEGQDATIRVADTPMFKCELGKKNNGVAAVQITDFLEQDDKETKNDRNHR
ncbi:MAG: FliM/FliN family flagellar motor switch protein, partial [Pseudomonadota bacterium]